MKAIVTALSEAEPATLQLVPRRLTPAQVLASVAAEFGVEVEAIRGPSLA